MRPTVVIVDDDDDTRDALSTLLRGEGYRVVAACDGEQALTLLRAGVEPEALVLDLDMPKMNGWELFDSIACEDLAPGAAIIVTSASAETAPAEAGAVFCKPYDVSQLLAVLRMICRRTESAELSA